MRRSPVHMAANRFGIFLVLLDTGHRTLVGDAPAWAVCRAVNDASPVFPDPQPSTPERPGQGLGSVVALRNLRNPRNRKACSTLAPAAARTARLFRGPWSSGRQRGQGETGDEHRHGHCCRQSGGEGEGGLNRRRGRLEMGPGADVPPPGFGVRSGRAGRERHYVPEAARAR